MILSLGGRFKAGRRWWCGRRGDFNAANATAALAAAHLMGVAAGARFAGAIPGRAPAPSRVHGGRGA
jgi:hypothetical protein